MVISAIAHLGRAEDRQVLLHLPVSLSSRQTAHRRLSGVHHDRSQSHRQWLAVTAPAGRADAVERVRPTCRAAPRCCQTKQVPKKGVEGRRREARRRPKKLRFISRGQKALAHPSLLPLNLGDRRRTRTRTYACTHMALGCGVRVRCGEFAPILGEAPAVQRERPPPPLTINP